MIKVEYLLFDVNWFYVFLGGLVSILSRGTNLTNSVVLREKVERKIQTRRLKTLFYMARRRCYENISHNSVHPVSDKRCIYRDTGRRTLYLLSFASIRHFRDYRDLSCHLLPHRPSCSTRFFSFLNYDHLYGHVRGNGLYPINCRDTYRLLMRAGDRDN